MVWPGHSLSSIFSGVLRFIHPDLDTVMEHSEERGSGRANVAAAPSLAVHREWSVQGSWGLQGSVEGAAGDGPGPN